MRTSQLYSIGNINDLQMLNMDEITMQRDNNFEFCMESKLLNNTADNQLILDGGFLDNIHNYHQHGISYFPEYEESIETIAQQSSMWLPNKLSLSNNEAVLQKGNKHLLEDNNCSLVTQKESSDLVGTENVGLSKWTSNKRIKATNSFEQQWHHIAQQASNALQFHKINVPARRSQKLSDKITTLQKLVSSYGKTDTASVLQEACLYIKLLQEQIQMLDSSYTSVRALNPQENNIGQKQVDLRSKGLCLVPVSFSEKVNSARSR